MATSSFLGERSDPAALNKSEKRQTFLFAGLSPHTVRFDEDRSRSRSNSNTNSTNGPNRYASSYYPSTSNGSLTSFRNRPRSTTLPAAMHESDRFRSNLSEEPTKSILKRADSIDLVSPATEKTVQFDANTQDTTNSKRYSTEKFPRDGVRSLNDLTDDLTESQSSTDRNTTHLSLLDFQSSIERVMNQQEILHWKPEPRPSDFPPLSDSPYTPTPPPPSPTKIGEKKYRFAYSEQKKASPGPSSLDLFQEEQLRNSFEQEKTQGEIQNILGRVQEYSSGFSRRHADLE